MEALALKSAVIAGHSIFLNAIGDVYVLVRDSTHHPQVSAVLSNLDLGADLKVIEALVNSLYHQHSHRMKKVDDPLAICTAQVQEMINKIKAELEEIHKIIKEHNETVWFAGYRTPNCDLQLNQIKIQKSTLDKRVNRLLQLVNVN